MQFGSKIALRLHLVQLPSQFLMQLHSKACNYLYYYDSLNFITIIYITSQLDHKFVSAPFLVPTVDGADTEGVVCPQDQSRAAVTLTGSL